MSGAPRTVGRARAWVDWSLVALIAAGILARILLVHAHRGFATGDQVQYWQLAVALADHLQYRVELGSRPTPLGAGAPFADPACLRLFGRGDSGLAGDAAQLLISVALVAAVYVLTRRMAGRTPALAATAFVASSPALITTSADLITEPLGGLLLLLAVGVIALLHNSPPAPTPRRTAKTVGAGALLGAAVLTRPDFLVYTGHPALCRRIPRPAPAARDDDSLRGSGLRARRRAVLDPRQPRGRGAGLADHERRIVVLRGHLPAQRRDRPTALARCWRPRSMLSFPTPHCCRTHVPST